VGVVFVVSNTLFLDPASWDLTVDINGNIAMASDPYSLAQDAASAIRTFQGEVFYDTTQGVPYWATVLGKTPSIAYLKSLFVAAALTVPGTVSAKCFIKSFTQRGVNGQVQITDAQSRVAAASF
jgi:hypothetical protein